MAYLAIDIGASSGRHIVSHIVDGKMVNEEIYRFPNKATKRSDGRLIWDVKRLYKEILNGLKRAHELNIDVKYVAIDTWAVDYALLDENDNLVDDVYSYRDLRGKIASEQVNQIIEFKDLYTRTGIQFQPFNTIYQLYDDKVNNRLTKAKAMLMLPDYFNYLLTGIKKQEYTNATSTGLVNHKTHTWDEEILDKLGIKKDIFLPIEQPGTILGKFTKEVSEFVGYEANVVMCASHDTASAIIAAPLNYGEAYISSGTWSLLGVEENFCHNELEAMKYNYSNEGDINYYFRFQKNIMGLWMIQEIRHELDDKYSFAEMAKMATENPSDIVIDVNDQRFLAPKSMIGEIKSVVGDVSLGQLCYIVYHSLAVCYKNSLHELEKLTNRKYNSLHIVGGGSNNQMLNELTAKECGVTVYAGPGEGTAIGNLLMQYLATQQIKDITEGRELVKKSFEIKMVKGE